MEYMKNYGVIHIENKSKYVKKEKKKKYDIKIKLECYAYCNILK
jgi:hypothetical protein